MKLTFLFLGAALAVPAIAVEPDPNPNRIQTDSIDRPVLNAPRPAAGTEPRVDQRTPRPERRVGEPAAGDTRPGGPSAATRPPADERIPSPSVGGSAASTRGKSLSPDD